MRVSSHSRVPANTTQNIGVAATTTKRRSKTVKSKAAVVRAKPKAGKKQTRRTRPGKKPTPNRQTNKQRKNGKAKKHGNGSGSIIY